VIDMSSMWCYVISYKTIHTTGLMFPLCCGMKHADLMLQSALSSIFGDLIVLQFYDRIGTDT